LAKENIMDHPLIGNLADLNLEQLQSKLTEINKRLSFSYKTGNQALVHQLQLVQSSYQQEYNRKMQALMPKDNDDKYGDKIDIS
jgi:hypothetical protein